ncbi:alpha-1-macroglobulin isoform X3 [Hydra vulgaris]|uniref:alpha-1-macroglobulin isoform X3 n=2 Tax=Hydra vulgaris TaxID=6087 RepID=UPI001F5FECD0|nr:alpha-1-macroglobulin-like isoform X1 [Hydra vulgaris]
MTSKTVNIQSKKTFKLLMCLIIVTFNKSIIKCETQLIYYIYTQRLEVKTEDFNCSERIVPQPCNWRYLTYFPNQFRTGSFENVVVSVFGFSYSVAVNITLKDSSNEKIYLSKIFDVKPEILNTLPLYIDHDAPSSLKLTLEGRGVIRNRVWVFKNETNYISVSKLGLNVLIQTDKPVYKPGQTIKCRVVVVNAELKPHKGKLKVVIENPSGTRMQQWNDVELNDGFASFELPTSEKPVMGIWKIRAEIDGYSATLEVEVKEYVLPQFQVTVKPPGFISKDMDEISTEVCAKYSYGKSVVGVMTAQVCQNKDYFNKQDYCLQVVKKIDGCATFKTSMRSLVKSLTQWYYPTISFNAQVKEEATGISLNSSVETVSVVNNPIKLTFEGSDVFKPGFPITVKLLASYIDNTPAGSILVNISAGTTGYSSSDLLNGVFEVKGGFLNVVLPDIPFNAQSINLLAIYERPKIVNSDESDWERQSSASKSIDAWYSPSHSYLFIEKLKTAVKNGTIATVLVHYTSVDTVPKKRTVYYSLVCTGNIRASGYKNIKFVAATSTTKVQSQTTTTAQPTTTTTTTTTKKNAESFFNNTDELLLSRKIILPVWGTEKPVTRPPLPLKYSKGYFTISFRVTSKMMPLCHMLVYYLYGNEVVADNTDVEVVNEFENKVSIAFGNEEVRPGDNVKLTVKGFPKSRVAIAAVDKSVHFLAKGNDIKPENLLKIREGLDIYPGYINNYNRCPWRERKKKSFFPGFFSQNFVDSEKAFVNVRLIVLSSLRIDVRPCSQNFFFPMALTKNMNVDLVASSVESVASKSETRVRKEFPETLLWTEEHLSENGTHVFDVKVPDTITSWYASGFGVSSSVGLGVAVPSELRVFQSFFVSLVLPYSVIQGEIVTLPAAVFSYVDGACITVRVTLGSSNDYKMISGPNSKVCLCGGRTATVYFKIQPTVIGKISIQVTAQTLSENVCAAYDNVDRSISMTDILVKKLLVEPEGLKQEYTFSNFICPNSPEKIFKYSFNLTLPANFVKGSVYSKITVVGDIMGSSLDNIDNLLEMPSGCGEQNMLKFAPNIFIMNYLRNTKQVNEEIKNKALNFMRTGYQRELTYKRADGSYSAFGENDKEGSTWLTAFVLKSYAQARPWIDVDQKEIQDPVNWLLQKQDSNGCFPTIGTLHHQAMKGGVKTPVTLTAYVLISLLEADIIATHPKLVNASKCVTDSLSNITDSYSLSIIAYMFAKIGDFKTYQSVIDTLNKLAVRKDGMVHWEETKVQETIKEPWYYQASSTDIEQTSYVLLAMLTFGKSSVISDVVPIVQWLSKQRNSLGGWSSTQDTVLAMQALSGFAEYSFGASQNMNVDVKAGETFSHTFKVTKDNNLVSQTVEGVPVPNTVDVVASGDGCSLIQTSVQYNVKEVTLKPSFQLTSSVTQVNEAITAQQSCKPQNIKVCAYYTGVGDSNMAIIDIQMISGFEPNKESLDKARNDKESNIKDIEAKGKSVVFYFEKISSSGTCIMFRVDQTTKVEKTKPAAIKVYDYYDTGKSATTLYEVTEEQCL